ncbi:hypothetical protein Gohar_000434, partial [Gossypium harknessii]|nr:hypothetical protein [Gossypium harknessii]
MTVYVNLDKPLISQILINGNIYRVEYEFLPSICFSCGRYRHVKGVCTNIVLGLVADSGAPMSGRATVLNDKVVVESGGADRSKEYGPWMVVKRKQLQNLRVERKKGREIQEMRLLLEKR